MDTNARPVRRLRCAIYTRKSSEEGLDMEFNSLDAQREACESYIVSQRSEGWVATRERYDDGGFSGGTLERPALKQLLIDIEDGLVDVIVVYKIDRLAAHRPDQLILSALGLGDDPLAAQLLNTAFRKIKQPGDHADGLGGR